MDISGKNVRLWINEHQKRDGGKWYDYNIGINKKTQDGKYITVYLKVGFVRDIKIPEDMPNGTKMNYTGYMTVDAYPDRDGNIVKNLKAMITEAEFPDYEKLEKAVDSYEQLEEDIPF